MITIPSKDIFDFINLHLTTDVNQLALKKNPFENYDWKWILNQIAAKKKAQDKLPTWFDNKEIIYPSMVSVEQTSSESLAKFKSNLFKGNRFIDLTGGFGIDTFYFSKQFTEAIHCEWNQELSETVAYNFEKLNVENVSFISGDSLDFLQKTPLLFDLIFVDPARRDATKKKVFRFEDCEPNVVEHMDLLFQKSDHILIKSSPLVDLQKGIDQLKFVKKIYVVSLKNDVKELLWYLEKDSNSTPLVEAVCIENDRVECFEHSLEDTESATYSLPKKYIYEPYSAVMKIGLFQSIGSVYKLEKLHQHSHLYTSETLEEFPGRIFEVEITIPYQKANVKEHISDKKMNVTTRNFPISVEDLRKKHKIKDGGTTYAFFTTNKDNEKVIVLCKKVK